MWFAVGWMVVGGMWVLEGLRDERGVGVGLRAKILALTPYLFVHCEGSTFEVVWSFGKNLNWFSFQSV